MSSFTHGAYVISPVKSVIKGKFLAIFLVKEGNTSGFIISATQVDLVLESDDHYMY